jgi:tripartite-type tricarboxylate transporter receptor subunit TctC
VVATHRARRKEIRKRLGEFEEVWRKGSDARLWEELAYCIFTAKGTPRPIVDRLNEELGAILRVRAVRDFLLNAGFEAVHSSPEELDAYLNDQVQKWRPIVRASGAVPD